MRYRKLDTNGDMVFGGSQNAFWTDVPDAVGQAVGTRLGLQAGEWFLDTTDGTNWQTGVLGNNTRSTRDVILKERILGTQGVNSLISYNSTFNGNSRAFTVSATIDTIYGQTQIVEAQ